MNLSGFDEGEQREQWSVPTNQRVYFFPPETTVEDLWCKDPLSLSLQTETEANVFCDELSIIISSISCVEYQTTMNLSPFEGPVIEPL